MPTTVAVGTMARPSRRSTCPRRTASGASKTAVSIKPYHRSLRLTPPAWKRLTTATPPLMRLAGQLAQGLDAPGRHRVRILLPADTAADIARLHGAQQTLMAASGMAAIATTLLTLLRAGDTVVASRQVYGDTGDLIERDLPGLGVTVMRIDAFDTDGWRQAIATHRPAVVYGETLSNPQLRLMDIPAVAKAARAVEAAVVIDNTFATPHSTRPRELGADAVVDSVTKFLAGHSDVVAGAVSTNARPCMRRSNGGSSPLGDAWTPMPPSSSGGGSERSGSDLRRHAAPPRSSPTRWRRRSGSARSSTPVDQTIRMLTTRSAE